MSTVLTSILYWRAMCSGLLLIATAPLQVTEKPLGPLPKEIRAGEVGVSQEIRPAQVIVSPDQTRFAWILRDENALRVVVDEKPQKPYDWIVQGKVDFSGDSRHLVYAVRKRGKAVMVIDGNEGLLVESISNWLLSPTGGHVAFAAKHNGRAHAIFEDVPGPPYDFVQLEAIAGEGTLAYLAVKGNQQFAIINGNESKAQELISDIRLSPNGKRFAYTATSNGQTRMIIDEQAGPAFDSIAAAQFSADSKHVAYLATRGNDSLFVLDGEAKTYGGKLSNLALSADGARHLFISTKDAKDTLYIDGAAGPIHASIATARFSADGRHIAYIVQTATGHTAVIDDKAVAHFDQILAVHSSPTGHFFAVVGKRNGKSLILLEARQTPSYDAILGRHPPVFLENSIQFLALKDGQIVQVTAAR